MPQIWEGALADKESHNWDDSDPVWRREYMGEWCPSDDVMVYSYSASLNQYDGKLPEGHDWKYILGMDIGFEDPTAIVVAAYADTHPDFFHVYDFKSPHLTVPKIAAAVKDAISKFGEMDVMVADTGGLGKTVIETLAEQYQLYFEKADKREKHDHIELVNSDLRTGRIKISADSYLESEMQFLQWKTKEKKIEDPSLDNHATDAFLYLWRYAYNHFWRPHDTVLLPGTDEYYENWENEQAEAAERRRDKRGQRVVDKLSRVYIDGAWS